MAKPAEDVQRPQPRLPGSGAFTGGVVNVTETAEAGGFAVRVAGGTEQRKRVLVALDRPLVAAKALVDVAEAVAGVRLAVAIAGASAPVTP